MHSGNICAVESQNSDKAVAPEILSDRNGSCAGFDFPVCLPVPDLWTSVLMKFLVSICDLIPEEMHDKEKNLGMFACFDIIDTAS